VGSVVDSTLASSQILARLAAVRVALGARDPASLAAAAQARPGWGFDISWPQCGQGYPTSAFDFAGVGVTRGQPLTANPCLADEFRWATSARAGGFPQLYVNLDLDGVANGRRSCDVNDHPCRAYNYGASTVDAAVSYADSQGVRAPYWWLDVETANAWSTQNLDWNAAVIRGAIEAMQARGLNVGIYSSSDQWHLIAGDYRPAVPSWSAVYTQRGAAPGYCGDSTSFTAGPVLMVQYSDQGFDQDYVCPAGGAAFTAAAKR
jgi:hypothetical protein